MLQVVKSESSASRFHSALPTHCDPLTRMCGTRTVLKTYTYLRPHDSGAGGEALQREGRTRQLGCREGQGRSGAETACSKGNGPCAPGHTCCCHFCLA